MKSKAANAVTGVVLLAVGVRLAWLLLVVNRQWSDVQYYDEAARHLAHHFELRYIDPDIKTIHYRAWFPVGWPFFLACFHFIFGDSPWIVKIVNLALAAVVAYLTVAIGLAVFGRRAALSGALIWALLPGQIFYVSLSQYEVFLTALTCGIVYLVLTTDWDKVTWRSPRLHALGILMAWATMTRPPLLLLPLVALPYIIQSCDKRSGSRKGWWWTAALTAYIGCTCLGWSLRNISVLGEPVLFSTNGGYNLWHGNNANATGGAFAPPHSSDPRLNPDALGPNELVLNRDCYRFAKEYIRAYPLHFLAMIPRRIWHLYNTDTTGLYLSFLYSPLERPTLLERFRQNPHFAESFTLFTYRGTMLFVLIGLALADWRSSQVRFLGLLILYWHLGVAVTFGQDRYRVPIMPIYCLFAGYAVQQLAWFIQQRMPKQSLDERSD